MGRYRWSILRVTSFVLFASCLLYLGLQGFLPAYYLYLSIMNVGVVLYIPIQIGMGLVTQLLGWVPSERTALIVTGVNIAFLQILQAALYEGVWQLVRRRKMRQQPNPRLRPNSAFQIQR
jgi:hypothetical protein